MEAVIKPEEVKVGIAEWQVARGPWRLVTLGLGSCVGIALYDPTSQIGGLAHIMLPDSSQFQDRGNRAKFADLALPDMLAEMLRRGARRSMLAAKIAGGAQMFTSGDRHLSLLNIGQRNTAMVRQTLQELGVPIIGADTGGNYGRTMIFDLLNGDVHIRTIGRPVKII
ncbi:Chemoreceptor glutamine deamidase CheD [Moorella glycerini]|uniref:Probable chemoreceptor glutamine deamidase CheD n=2 Tax=Neomoorella TaxID=44260 RepID=A0A9X7P5V5_9FIRM|nr:MULTISPECIES: chemotaxis protein CheD [Moorella]KYH32640.1 chemoreceptor glutamine deamidase CheD [Moorella mulderi DSM 14980]PRR72264.1 Chemoreceptor glutamine deamidase CheD [Moorella stamsii]CEP69565.1 Chemoreceptor glutamine deamidase CheD [Moorella glycerini]